ncbi:MAG: nickel-responsive transcriptional regulator NikR [Candidatus Bathyarchaeia archaeon]
MGIAIGGNERMFDKAAMTAVSAIAFIIFMKRSPGIFCVTNISTGNTTYKSFAFLSNNLGDEMSSKQRVVRFSVSLPPRLVRELDEVWRSMRYVSRSKAVHDALRNFISEYRWMREEAGKIAGAIVILYYLDKPGLLNKIMQVQHKFEDIITSTMHIHLAKNKCLEIVAVNGDTKAVRSLTQELMTKKGVKQLKFTAIAL